MNDYQLMQYCTFKILNSQFAGGIQQPIVKCVRNSANTYSNPKRCAHLNRPVLSDNLMKCNSQPCPAFWKISDWTDCKCGEFDERENQTREVKCVQELISGVVIQVSPSLL
jgi:hypothetical protein